MPASYREFLLHRLHSLSGILPLGLYLAQHLFVNSYSRQGPAAFNAKADFLRRLPYLLWIEVLLLGLPFAFHILYGLKIMYAGQSNLYSNPYARNWLYVLQRLSAIPALAFILVHVYTVRILNARAEDLYAVMAGALSRPAVFALYAVGVVSICFHFANGLAAFCVRWGITISPASQRVVGYACAAAGAALAGMGLWAMLGFSPQAAG